MQQPGRRFRSWPARSSWLPPLRSWLKEERSTRQERNQLLRTTAIGLLVILPLIGLQLQRRIALILHANQANREDTLALMEANLAVASRAARDWGHWGNTYSFARGTNPDYERNSLDSGAVFEDGAILLMLGVDGKPLLIHTAQAHRRRSYAALSGCVQSVRRQLTSVSSTARLGCFSDQGSLYLGAATPVSDDKGTAPPVGILAMLNPLVEQNYTPSIRHRLELLRRDLIAMRATGSHGSLPGDLILPAIHSNGSTLLGIRRQPLLPVVGLALVEDLPLLVAIPGLALTLRVLAMLRRRKQRINQRLVQRLTNSRIRHTCKQLEDLLTSVIPDHPDSRQMTSMLGRMALNAQTAAAEQGTEASRSAPVQPEIQPEASANKDRSDVSSSHQLERLTNRFQRFLHTASDLALLDSLTRLPNRRYFLEQVHEVADRYKQLDRTFALLFIDVDRFKVINDTYGHAVGDAVLITVCQRLKSLLQPGDFLGRYGGDELAMILDLSGLQDHQEQALLRGARSRAKQFLEALNEPVLIRDQPIAVSLSIGITLVAPGENDISAMIQRSDLAMYQAKRRSRGLIIGPDDDVSSLLLSTHELFTDLIQAIQNRQLQIFLQAIVDGEGLIRGVEALARWHHPDRGWIEPLLFLEMADQHRRSRQLCDELIRLSLDSFQKLLTIHPEMDLFINLSPGQLQDPELANDILQQLQLRNLPARKIILELTEQGILEPNTCVTSNLEQLRQAGIRLALDDFGTGTSSLMLLKTLRPEVVKIDMGFIQAIRHDAEARHIIELIVELGQRLKLELVAEGIEDRETLMELVNLGLQRFQGYEFGHPMPVQDFLDAEDRSVRIANRAMV